MIFVRTIKRSILKKSLLETIEGESCTITDRQSDGFDT